MLSLPSCHSCPTLLPFGLVLLHSIQSMRRGGMGENAGGMVAYDRRRSSVRQAAAEERRRARRQRRVGSRKRRNHHTPLTANVHYGEVDLFVRGPGSGGWWATE
ncbi:hypothetical protein B0H10DRAFT_1964699 [Mycena sp. CBHHK59/15]|nr:hypothetical protein B0H10DRAFT_1964699 [Mycena sp. CBHHK59/15]